MLSRKHFVRRHFILGVLSVFLIVAAIPALSQAASVEHLSGSLRQFVLEFPTPAAGTDQYTPPTVAEVDAFRKVIDDITAGRLDAAAVTAESLNYRTILYHDTDRRVEHVVLVESPPEAARAWRGIFVFSRAPDSRRRGLVFQSPHPLYDLNTKAEATDLYLETSATALVIAGTHRNNSKRASPCDGDYKLSDMAHAEPSFFQAVHEELYFGHPETVAVSVHGMGPKTPPHDVSVSNGTQEDIAGYSLSREIVAEMNRLLAMDPKDKRLALSHQDAGSGAALPGTTNIQGRFSNGAADPCTQPVASALFPERFIHMEQTRAVRDTPAQYAFVVQAYKNLFDFLEPAQYALQVEAAGPGSVVIDPPGGVYDPGTVVSLTAVADAGEQFSHWTGDLTGGANPTTLVMDGDKWVRAVFPRDYADLPYATGFEDGALDRFWEIRSSDPAGRIQVTTAHSPHRGQYHLTMDVSSAGTFSTNEAWLRLNLEEQAQVRLRFWWKEFSDENHGKDGVFLSDDGGDSFVKVHALTGGRKRWKRVVLDIDEMAAANGLRLTGTFVFKFQQRDNHGIAKDGFAFDDISIRSE